MIIDVSTKEAREKSRKISKWQEAANYARTKIEKLERSVKYYLEMDAKGEPWPGDAQQKAPAGAGAGTGEK